MNFEDMYIFCIKRKAVNLIEYKFDEITDNHIFIFKRRNKYYEVKIESNMFISGDNIIEDIICFALEKLSEYSNSEFYVERISFNQ